MRGLTLGLSLAAASMSAPLAAAPSPDLMEKMVGHWVLTGEIAGQTTTHDVDAEWVLQGRYVQIRELAREKDAAGNPGYEATILVGWKDDHYVCFWFDVTEVASPDVTCTATPAGDTIPFEFRDGTGALSIVNTFAYDRSRDSWSWLIDNVAAGRRTRFAEVSLHRK